MKFSKYYGWDKDRDKEILKVDSSDKSGIEAKPLTNDARKDIGFAGVMKMDDLKEGDIFATYIEILEFGEEILKKVKEKMALGGSEIEERVSKLVDGVIAGEKFFLEFVFRELKQESEARHMVNTTILALVVGLELGYNKSRLFELAIGAFLHDVGLVGLSHLTKAERRLSKSEYEEIKKHPIHSLEILKRVGNLSQEILHVAHEHHERLDGSGYPLGLEDGNIHENAHVLGIVDMFEAMTHERPYRRKMTSYAALKELINMGADVVEPQYVEALVHRIGLYPIGSWVELSTGEIGKVIEVNKNFSLRPVVSVIYKKNGNKLKEAKVIDISKQPIIFIRRVLGDKEVADIISM